MVEPNFNLMLWIMLILWAINAIAGMLMGIVKEGEPKEYGIGDSVMGVLILVLVALIIFT